MMHPSPQLADCLLAARNCGLAVLPPNYWQLSLAERAEVGTDLLINLREQADAGCQEAQAFLASPWAIQLPTAEPPQSERAADYSAAAQIIATAIESLPANPTSSQQFSGLGIVTCAGGPMYQTCAWVLFSLLRKLGCTLPIECWYSGASERSEPWERWVAEEFGVTCLDAEARGYVGHRLATPPKFRGHSYPPGTVHGYALKPFAVLHSSFQEVLFLDADNTPERDPTFLLDGAEFRQSGAMFWPDLPDCTLAPDLAAFGVAEPESCANWESGQIVLDKQRCLRPLALTNWFNAQAPYFYQHSWGDCGTWQAAWRRLAAPHAMPASLARRAGSVAIVQHDFQGQPLFYHRVGRRGKWRLDLFEPTPGFSHNAACKTALEELARRMQSLA